MYVRAVSNIFQIHSDIWAEVNHLCNRTNCNESNIHEIIRHGKSDNTNKKYDFYFRKFRKWCETNDVQYMPASVGTVAVFLSSLVQSAVSNAVFSAYHYSIKWQHDVNLCVNPCENKMITLLCEGAKRILSRPVKKKDPINFEVLEKVVTYYSHDERVNDLSCVRICTMFLVGFSGF